MSFDWMAHIREVVLIRKMLTSDKMPIVDGLTSTKMIRSFEKTHPKGHLSHRAAGNGRVPIFAVSASLLERDRQTYTNAGFDGWVLKPIDFKRLNTLLAGIVNSETRNSCLYKPGVWERGGWFHRRHPSGFHASTTPSEQSNDSSESGSVTPTQEPRRPLIHDERLDIPTLVEEEPGNIQDT